LVEGDDPKRGIDYLTEYSILCTELKDIPGQGAASSALARAHLRLDSVPLAVEHLERFLQIAKKTDDLSAQASACCNLGIIYNRRGEFAKAVHFFEKNYETCRSMVTAGLGSRKLVDQARVHLGMARGNANMDAYMFIVNEDMPSLLRWKNRRFNFAGAGESKS
jgi:tetratricopeptide (TPR) repeat protein